PQSSFVRQARSDPSRVRIFDTTLRDGEQSPGASLTTREKVEIARSLEAMGVDIIEAGFPITSQDDFEAVRSVSRECRKVRVAGLARCVEADIKRAAEALKGAARPRIHVFLATSAIHRKYKLKKAKSEIVRLAVEGVKLARKFCDEVEFSPEDASRTEDAFLAEVVEAAIAAGAGIVNIPDTVGYAVPDRFSRQITYLRERVPNIEDAVISVHCHNDLGLAVANSLAAVEAGARQVECTINGLGERAGNASLEEFVMTLRTRKDHYGLTTGVDTRRILPTSRQVSKLTGISVQRNKAIVGENAFAHEAGIHVHGMLCHAETYEIMRPEDVGYSGSKIVIGKHTGHHAVEARVKSLGYKLSKEQLERVKVAVKDLADRKKSVFDADLEAILRDEVGHDVEETFALAGFQVMTGKDLTPMATVSLTVLGDKDDVRTDASAGDGPVSAIFTAVDRLTGVKGELEDYRIEAVTGGREAMGEVHITVKFGGEKISARGASPDVLEASALAYLQAVNRLVARRGSKLAPKKRPK
ncbi:MAG: 2-isopropylmalate synthase, partial [Planctomycetota bacterium]